MAAQHPAVAPYVTAWQRAQRVATWCAQRLQWIGQRVAHHLGVRKQWEAEGGLWRGVLKLAKRAGASFGGLAKSDAWLAKQARPRERTERVLAQRQAQMERLQKEGSAAAQKHRKEIEAMRAPLVQRHERRYRARRG